MNLLAKQACEKILKIDPRFIDAHLMQGVICAQQQRFVEAAGHFKRITGIDPAHLGARYNQGLMWLNAGQMDEAEAVFQQVLALDGKHIPALNSLGVLHAQTGRFEQAIPCFQTSLELAPGQPEVLNNLGNCALELGQIQEAEHFYLRALEQAPGYWDAIFNLAKLYARWQKPDSAIQRYLDLLNLNPGFAPARVNLAKLLIDEGRAREAVPLLREGVAHMPQDADMWYSLGVALKESEDYPPSIEAFDRALALRPGDPRAHVNRAASLRELNQFEAALTEIRQAEGVSDAHTQSVMWSLYASLYEDTHQEEKVEDAFLKAMAADPEHIKPRMNHGMWLLKHQRFKEAWPFYQLRHEIKASRPIQWMAGVPVWTRGLPIGRLLILGEQGVGDQVFHSKFLRVFIQRHGKPACVTVDQRLLPAYQRAFPGLHIWPQSRRADLRPEDFDVQLGMADLAALLDLDPCSDPVLQQPSLTPDPGRAAFFPAPAPRPLVGLSWKSANAKNSLDKSLPLAEVATALGHLDATWINLQYGDVRRDISDVKDVTGFGVQSLPDLDVFQDLEGLIQLIHECDFIVTSSNSTAHFAGALGKPGVVLVPFNKGKLWYWHTQDGPSVWYPTLHVIHCKAHNDWAGALAIAQPLIRNHFGTSH